MSHPELELDYADLLNQMAGFHGIQIARQAMKRQVFIDPDGNEISFSKLEAELVEQAKFLDVFVIDKTEVTPCKN